MLAIGFFLACASLMSYEVAYGDTEVTINRLVELGPDVSKIVFMLLALFSFGLVAYAIMAVRASLMPDRNIVISSNHVSIPDSILRRGSIDIPLTGITGLSLKADRNSRVLHIQHRAGTTKATQRFFQDRSHFEDFLAQLQIAVRG
ncbi:MAG: hypothetical protein J0H31_27665 [Alphaproteobacteria bacterium]|nr:hypothetical protein [Alphaproteobacteria bacterium]